MIQIFKALKIVCTILVFLTFVSGNGETATFHVSIENHKMTIKATNVSIEAVMQEISSQSGISIQFHTSSADPITLDLNDIPMHLGLSKILKNYSHAVIYEENVDKNEKVIRSLYIFSKIENNATAIVWNPEAEMGNGQETRRLKKGIRLTSQRQEESNPLKSMHAVDPLASFDDNPDNMQPPMDPMLLDPHKVYLKSPVSN